MCGRFTLHLTDLDELRIELGVEEILIADWTPRYNIAPSQGAPVVRDQPAAPRRVELLRWGLVPRWAKDLSVGTRAINARAETLRERPTFRDAYAHRRCLVPASGFFEWRRAGGATRGGTKKQAILVEPADPCLMVLAGLWDEWISSEGEVVQTFSIVTTDACGRLRDIHDRMPLMLDARERERWLEPEPLRPNELQAIVSGSGKTAPLRLTPVGPQVNTAGYDAPDCIEPTTETPPGAQLELF